MGAWNCSNWRSWHLRVSALALTVDGGPDADRERRQVPARPQSLCLKGACETLSVCAAAALLPFSALPPATLPLPCPTPALSQVNEPCSPLVRSPLSFNHNSSPSPCDKASSALFARLRRCAPLPSTASDRQLHFHANIETNTFFLLVPLSKHAPHSRRYRPKIGSPTLTIALCFLGRNAKLHSTEPCTTSRYKLA